MADEYAASAPAPSTQATHLASGTAAPAQSYPRPSRRTSAGSGGAVTPAPAVQADPAGAPGGPAKRGKRNFVRKKKVCRFCVDKADFIDYKKAEILGAVHPGARQDSAAPHDRHLRAPPALADGGDQAGAEHRAACRSPRNCSFTRRSVLRLAPPRAI